MTETKNYFEQRVPGFIDSRGLIRANFEFTKTEELLEHPYIQNWMKNEGSSIYKMDNMIIVKTDKNDDIGFVVGYVRNPDDVELPLKVE